MVSELTNNETYLWSIHIEYLFIELFVLDEVFYVSDTPTQWGKAQCTMASPDLTFSKEGVQINMSKLTLSRSWNETWIGYLKEFVAYEYIGSYVLSVL